MKDMLSLSQERFSARKFTQEAVSEADLQYVLECVHGTIGMQQAAMEVACSEVG